MVKNVGKLSAKSNQWMGLMMMKPRTLPGEELGDRKSLSCALQSHPASQPERFKLGATLCKWLVWNGNEQVEFFMFKARSWEHDLWIAKNPNYKESRRKVIRTTSPTKVKFPYRTTTPWTEIGISGEQLCVCGMVSDTTIPLVDQTPPQVKNPQVMHESSDTVTSDTYWTHHVRCTCQHRFCHQNVEYQSKSRAYTSYKMGMKIWTLPE